MRLVILIFFLSLVSNAAIPPLQVPSPVHAVIGKQNKFVENGKIVGGQAQTDLVLVGVRTTFSKTQSLARVILDISKSNGKMEKLGFFHVEVDQKLKRIVIDLDGVAASQQALEQITKTIEKSPFVKKAELTMDPEDRSANLTLNLKDNLDRPKVEAFELAPVKNGEQSNARLAIDITSQSLAKSK